MKLVHLLVAVCVSGALVFAGWFVDDLFARIVIGAFVLIGFAMSIATFRDMMVYARADGIWRVEINSLYVIWQSPVERLFRSFRIKIEDIASLRFVQVRSGGTKSRTLKREFFIHLNTGQTMQIPAQEGGIWVHDVFEVLEKQGVRYDHEHLRSKDFEPQKKSFEIIPMEAWTN
ncbi:MAG: hypothetical protein ABJO88_02910 [Parasphingorhabdus sp.]